MRKFQCWLLVLKRSCVFYYMICMTVRLTNKVPLVWMTAVTNVLIMKNLIHILNEGITDLLKVNLLLTLLTIQHFRLSGTSNFVSNR